MSAIHALVMPKWGLSMSEGKVVEWLVSAGTHISAGEPVLDVETDKIASSVEATDSGELRRLVAEADQVLPVGALLGVLTEGDVSDEQVDAFVSEFQDNFIPPEPTDEITEPSTLFAEIEGCRMRYARRGDADSVAVMVHGFGGDLDNWLFNLDELASEHTVYAIDLPGHGQSDKALNRADVEGFAATVNAFLNDQNIEQAHLVGHSLGGSIALQLALDQGQKVRSLALLCSAGLGPEINSDYIQTFTQSNSRREVKKALEQLFADPALVSRQLVDDILKYKRLDGVATSLQRIADSAFANDQQQNQYREQLARIAKPVLVVWGRDDRIIPVSHSDGLEGDVRVEIVETAGHMVQMEAASTVNRWLLEHFSSA